MGKWVLVTSLLMLSIVVAFGIFIVTGVIDGPALFWRIGPKIAWLQPYLQTYSHGLDGEVWLDAQKAELEKQLAEVQLQQSELDQEAEQLEERSQLLEKLAGDLEKEKSLFQAEQAQRRSVAKLAEIYTEMAPEEAAKILGELDQSLILEILLSMDIRDAASVLTRLPTNLAVALSKELGHASE